MRLLPELTPFNEWFWTSGKDGVLRVQGCDDCDVLVHPPSPICPSCRSRSRRVVDVSGKATVIGFTVNHHQWLPGFDPPYVIANVALAEDPSVRITTNIVGCDPDDVAIGQVVQVGFEQYDDFWDKARDGEVSNIEADTSLLSVLFFRDFGLESYGLALAASDDYIAENPDAVRCFVDGVRQGFEAAQADPEAALQALYEAAPETEQAPDGKSATITVRFGELPPDKHTLSISVPDATPHSNTATLAVTFNTSPLLLNGDFEQGGGAAFATHWRHAAWGRKPETQYDTVVAEGEGRSGNAVKLTGIADPLYLIVGQEVPLQAGQSCVFSGYYRTEADQKLGVSLVGTQTGELKQQYVESPPFTPSTEWAPFEWEVLAEAGHPEFEVFLWSKSKGSVWFDDLQLMPKQ